MKESPLFAKSYDFTKWLLTLTLKFPREHRFVLAHALQQRAIDFHERLIEAVVSGTKRPDSLRRADMILAKLRFHVRLCHDLKLISTGQYEHGARYMDEIGRLLGAWLKKEQERETV